MLWFQASYDTTTGERGSCINLKGRESRVRVEVCFSLRKGLLDSQSRTRLQDCVRQTEKKEVNGEVASVWRRARGGQSLSRE